MGDNKEINEEVLNEDSFDKIMVHLNHVDTILIDCPLDDECINNFFNRLRNYNVNFKVIEGDFYIENIHITDLLSVMMCIFKESEINSIKFDFLSIVLTIIQSFKNINFVSFRFSFDNELTERYNILIRKSNSQSNEGLLGSFGEIVSKIYHIKRLKIVMSDLFSQDIIDDFNKNMMFDGILPNDYLNRVFEINFEFDEFMSYMEFIFNDCTMFEKYGTECFESILTYPSIYMKDKPEISYITNYRDM